MGEFMKAKINVIFALCTLLFLTNCSQVKVDNEDLKTEYEITDCLFTDDFIEASNEISMELSEIKNINKLGDWVAGTIYEIHYLNNNGKVYCNIDNTVESINFSDTKVYFKDHESLMISDYLVDQSIAEKLKLITVEKVKNELNYPESADFSLFSWGFIHWEDIYGVSSIVKAKNAFGVESELKFNLHFNVSENSTKLEYFNLNGEVISGELKNYQKERKENITETSDGDLTIITLIDGELGEYGKRVKVDGYDYIYYYLPIGKYKVYSDVNFCKVYLDKNKTVKNSEGYIEPINVITLTFNKGDDFQELTINEEEHIEITLSAKVRFEKIE